MKKTSTRKIVSLLLCVILVVSLCSCSSSRETTSDSNKNTEVEGASTSTTKTGEYKYEGKAPISNDKVKISILTTNSGSKILGFKDMVWCQEILKRANVEIEMEEIDISAYNDVLRPRLAAAVDLPDIINLNGQDNDMSYINSGIFLELTDYYEKYGYNFKMHFKENPTLKAQITTPDGEIYYVPRIRYIPDNSRCLMINARYTDELGMKISDLKTIDDYYNFLVAVKNADLNNNNDNTDEIPLFMRSGMIGLWAMYWGLDIADSGGFQVENGKVICGYLDNRYREFLAFFNKLYKEGLLYSEYSTANLDVQTALFADNQIGSLLHFISNCTGYSKYIDPEWDLFNDDPIMVPLVPPIIGPYGDQCVYGRDIVGSFYGITSACKDPVTAFCFVDYLYSQEAGEIMWFGIEGEDYNIVNGEHVPTEAYLKNPDNYLNKRGYNSTFVPGYQVKGGYLANQCKAVIEASEALADYIMNPTIAFSFKLPEENEILQTYSADLSTYFNENLDKFIMGIRPLSEWDSYISEAEKMGLSEVIKVYQASVDRASAVK